MSNSKAEAQTEVRGTGVYPLQRVRQGARRNPALWHLSHLLPRNGAQRADSGRHEVELVGE